ncbi:MAG: Uncharacterized membrane protein YsdA, DUF1294 family [Candidatus Electronema aureum]|uniref:Uncharacterized membrane protein YsdA, DUF1294 family n=1 Tax=Candidatus Electronema aureum TaxID=2005002 RepID=A0A521G5D2_9BACT|nr:MAG: Uncharacterized membrane protein YsdA, DUF1294 family [Candidatus Electronema aureum]
MRNQGTLTSWNDEKGFGFITPDDDSRQIFVRIKSFSNRGRRPKINQAVNYTLSSDSKGRPCAANVLFAGKQRTSRIGSSVIALLFIATVAFSSFHLNKIPRLIFWWYVIASLLTFIIYSRDKTAAKNGSWRTPESSLHLLALLCGWPGALIAQQILRHKSKKQAFRVVFWITVLLNCGAFVLLFIPEVSVEVQYWFDVKLKFWISNTVKQFLFKYIKID